MTKRMITMLLAAVILLSANGCAPAPDTAENNSSTSSAAEELQVLQEENEKLKQELAELKGEAPSEEQDTEAEGEEPKEEAKTESGTASEPAAKPTAPAEKPAEKPAAPAANNQAAKPQAEKPAANNTQTTAKPQTPAPQKTSTGKGPLAKYTVRVKDKTTPAVDVRGRIHEGEAAYVFLSENGEVLGTVPDSNIPLILQQEGLTQAEDDEQKSWFVENFNIYRGLDGSSYEGGSGSSGGGSSSSSEIDIEEFKDEVIRLVNEAREDEGLEPLVAHPTAMEFAQIRAEEISNNFSHKRPDGTVGEYSHYQFMENIAMKHTSPEEVVDAWLHSPGHRAAIMTDYSDYGNGMGVGIYKKNGALHWVLEFISWDAEG